jgi:hypothetical protein
MRSLMTSTLGLAYRSAIIGVSLLALVVTYSLLRPNLHTPPGALHASLVTTLPRTARHDGMSDLIRWRGQLWLAHVASPWHFASDRSRIVLRRSGDGRAWTEVARFSGSGEDIREPKLAVIGDRLHLYWLQNRDFPEPNPYSTFVSASADGLAWEAPEPVRPEGWLLWRPRTLDGVTHYVTAYSRDHGRAALFRSTDGRTWTHVSDVASGGHLDETGFTFVGRRIVAVTRLEGVGPRPWVGDRRGGTLIATAAPPYSEWTATVDLSARLDGPRLFTWRGQAYAVGRYDPLPPEGLVGSVLSRKRTALYLIDPAGLRLLTILPSAGDTSYPGAVVSGDEIVVSYYTSRTDRDYPWLLGMLLPSELRLARIPLLSIGSLADARPASIESEG